MVLGMLRDKAWRGMASQLAPAASRLVVAPVSSPRTVAPDELRQALQEAHCGRAVRACATVDEALRAVAREPFVAVTGSLYFIGEFLERLEAQADGDRDELPKRLEGYAQNLARLTGWDLTDIRNKAAAPGKSDTAPTPPAAQGWWKKLW